MLLRSLLKQVCGPAKLLCLLRACDASRPQQLWQFWKGAPFFLPDYCCKT